MASSINKICVIGPTVIHTYCVSRHCIPKKLRFGLCAGGVIGPYFFPDDQDRYVTVNGNRYRSMKTEYFWPQWDDMDLEDMWFQQHGATSHTANVTINLLETKSAVV